MFNVQSFFFLACVRRLSSSSSSSSSSNQRINRSFWLCFNYIPFAGHKFCSTNCALRKHWHYIKNGQFSKNMWMCARIRACVDLCLLENWNTIFFATNKQKQQRKKNQKLNDKTQKIVRRDWCCCVFHVVTAVSVPFLNLLCENWFFVVVSQHPIQLTR